jgi:hypothetical protein
MGYNRSGHTRLQKIKRRRREEARLAKKHAAAEAEANKGVVQKTTGAVKSVAAVVGEAVTKVVKKVTGKK